MSDEATHFWREIDTIRELVRADDHSQARKRLADAVAATSGQGGELHRKRTEFLSTLAKTYDIDLPAEAGAPSARSLGPIRRDGIPGVSLVTCCKNRNENLLRALPSWIACEQISEIVIVDWSSDTPVRDDIDKAGIFDPRIRVIRVENEPRWILSFAFNIGFRVAAYDRILKVDADVVVSEDFFDRNTLEPETFVAGNWRTAMEGQQFLNGFFYAWKADLAQIGGFNEHITTYGWDDDELYQRLADERLTRIDVANGTVHHLSHTDEDRIDDPDAETKAPRALPSAREELTAETQYLIRRNRFIANVMPRWSGNSVLLPIKVRQEDYAGAVVERQGWVPNEVPASVQEDANYYALSEITSWKLGKRVRDLGRAALDTLLTKPLSQITRADVEVALSGRPAIAAKASRYLILQLTADQVENPDETVVRTVVNLSDWAQRHGLTTIVRSSFNGAPKSLNPCFGEIPFIGNWTNIGGLEELDPASLRGAPATMWLDETRPLLVRLDKSAIAQSAVEISVPKRKLFIDAQHGMGNRLRAIASAACIAEKTERELVLVWNPDNHCDCRFSDLFDYEGAVVDEAFVRSAPHLGCNVYNYMEIEDGAQKNQPVDASLPYDIYARSAFVLNSPLTDWSAENRFLRDLTPTQAVRELIARVRHPNDVSAHIRMQAGKGLDNNSYDSAEGNWSEADHELIQHWRDKSHFSHFMKRVDQLISAGLMETLFVAADLPETYNAFKARFGDRVAFLPRDVNDRSAEQLRYGLADAILLGRSKRLLGSTWSSFSELAMRLAPGELKVEMSGKDFGPA